MAQWIRHRPTEPGIAGSSPAGVIESEPGRACLASIGRTMTCFLRSTDGPVLGRARLALEASGVGYFLSQADAILALFGYLLPTLQSSMPPLP